LVCITPGRGCAALGYGWQNQPKALKGRNKWRTRQSPICKLGVVAMCGSQDMATGDQGHRVLTLLVGRESGDRLVNAFGAVQEGSAGNWLTNSSARSIPSINASSASKRALTCLVSMPSLMIFKATWRWTDSICSAM
jgi:hypothetical protein